MRSNPREKYTKDGLKNNSSQIKLHSSCRHTKINAKGNTADKPVIT